MDPDLAALTLAPVALAAPVAEDCCADDGTATMLSLVNAEREQQGLASLEVSAEIKAAASVRVLEVEERFSHDRPDGTLESLLDESDVEWTVAAETLAVAVAPTPAAAADQAYRSWMSSAEHRDILLSPEYARTGIAIGQSQGRWLFVELVAD